MLVWFSLFVLETKSPCLALGVQSKFCRERCQINLKLPKRLICSWFLNPKKIPRWAFWFHGLLHVFVIWSREIDFSSKNYILIFWKKIAMVPTHINTWNVTQTPWFYKRWTFSYFMTLWVFFQMRMNGMDMHSQWCGSRSHHSV